MKEDCIDGMAPADRLMAKRETVKVVAAGSTLDSVDDIIGKLEIPEHVADGVAQLFESGYAVELSGAITKEESGRVRLLWVSIGPKPATPDYGFVSVKQLVDEIVGYLPTTADYDECRAQLSIFQRPFLELPEERMSLLRRVGIVLNQHAPRGKLPNEIEMFWIKIGEMYSWAVREWAKGQA